MMDADYGGTEIRAALEFMFRIRSRDMPTSCFVLTDGEAGFLFLLLIMKLMRVF